MDFENLIAQLLAQSGLQKHAQATHIQHATQAYKAANAPLTPEQQHVRNATSGGVLDAGQAQFGRAYTDGVRRGAMHEATPPTRASVGLDVIGASPPAYQPGIVRGARPPMGLDIGQARNIQSAPLGLDIGPARINGDLDIGPAQNITHPGDQARKGGQPVRQDGVQMVSGQAGGDAIVNPSAVDGMPVIMGGQANKAANHAMRVNDIAALRERGEDIPEWMYQGLYPNEIADAHRSGAEMDGYRLNGVEGIGRPFSELEAPRRAAGQPLPKGYIPLEPAMTDGVYRGQSLDEMDRVADEARQGKRMKAAVVRARDVADHGWDPEMFDGMTGPEAAKALSDHMQVIRQVKGDPTAWWSTFADNI